MLYEITIRRLTTEQHSILLNKFFWSFAIGASAAFSVAYGHKIFGKLELLPSDLRIVLLGVGASMALQMGGFSIICGAAMAGHYQMKKFDPLRDLPRQSNRLAGVHFIGSFAAFVGVAVCFLAPFEDKADGKGCFAYLTFGVISVLLWGRYLRLSLNQL